MTTHADIVRRWHEVTQGSSKNNFQGSESLFARGDRIFSWGSHFELARPLRNRKGEVEAYLLNGDRISNSTSRHQDLVRSELRGETTVIIPHEALNAAGINLDSIRVLEVQEDRWETTWHHSEKLEDVPETWRNSAKTTMEHHANNPNALTWWFAHHDEHGIYHWRTDRHWLGGSLIRAKVEWEDRSDGWKRKHRWATFLSSFDEQESRPSYFFCELPAKSKATTIEQAYEDLKPDTVKMAEQMGRKVTRQGDIFAVPTELTKAQLRKMGARFERMGDERVVIRDGRMHMENRGAAQLLGTNHRATEVARVNGLTLARGVLWHKPEGRNPDHKRQPMGDRKGWHIVLKNTVPTAA